MNNRMRRWIGILLALCLMTGGPWLLKTGRCEPMSWNDADANQQAAVLNALKCALSDPELREKALAFAEQLSTRGLGGLLQDRLPLDLTQLSDAEQALTKDFLTAIENGDIGGGGLPYITVTYEEGQWKLAVTNGRRDVASPGAAPITRQDEDRKRGTDNPGFVTVPGGAGISVDTGYEDLVRQILGQQSDMVAILNWDMGTTDHLPATVTFSPKGISDGMTVTQYHNGAWGIGGSSSGPTITVTFNDF